MKKLIFLIIFFSYCAFVYSQNQNEFIAGFTSDQQIFLRWMKKNEDQRFNIYRSMQDASNYILINTQPVKLLTTRYEILTLLGDDYPDYKTAFKLDYPEQIAALYHYQPGFLKFASVFTPKLAMILGEGFIDNTVLPGNTYYYKIEVLEGDSKKILVKDFKLVAEKKICSAPKNLQVITGAGENEIYWDTNDKKAVGYFIYRSSNGKSGNYKKLNIKKLIFSQNKIDSKGNPNYVDTNIEKKGIYWYKVVALNIFGEAGSYSEPVSSK